MRSISIVFFTAMIFLCAAQARSEVPSCYFRTCMSICRDDFDAEYSCTGMCGRIISLCRRLVPKPERTGGERRQPAPALQGRHELNVGTHDFLGRID